MQGHIHKRVHSMADGRMTTTWYVVVDVGRDKNGRRRQKWHGGFRTRKEAEAARAKLVNDMNTGVYVAPNGMTLGEYVIDRWLPSMRTRLKPSTWDSYRRNMELHVLPRLGNWKLADVSPVELNRLYADLLESGRRDERGGLSAKTVRYIHTTLHKALADAVDDQIIGRNVATNAKPPRPEKRFGQELRFWTAEELGRFLRHVDGHCLAPAFRLAALTGMRRGEVLGLRWRDIDWDFDRLAVRHTLVSVAYDVQSSTPKTHQARVIDLDAETVRALREHRSLMLDERESWGDDFIDDDLVFSREDGSPIHPDVFSQIFENEVRKARLPRIRLHDLRHTHATLALKAGVPVKVISERLGHESPAFTMKQYAHALPGMQAEAASLVASLVQVGPKV